MYQETDEERLIDMWKDLKQTRGNFFYRYKMYSLNRIVFVLFSLLSEHCARTAVKNKNRFNSLWLTYSI